MVWMVVVGAVVASLLAGLVMLVVRAEQQARNDKVAFLAAFEGDDDASTT
jgi:hypothetical protein